MADCAIAVVTDSIVYTASYLPFEKPPDALTINSLIPRGVRRFELASAATAVKPVNDQIRMLLTATLPLNFAYILTRFSLAFIDTRAADWDAMAVLRVSEAGGGASAEHFTVPLDLFGSAPNPLDSRLVARPTSLAAIAAPFWARAGDAAVFLQVEMVDTNNTVTLGGTVTSHIEFLEYDLTQAQRYWINTLIPVLSR